MVSKVIGTVYALVIIGAVLAVATSECGKSYSGAYVQFTLPKGCRLVSPNPVWVTDHNMVGVFCAPGKINLVFECNGVRMERRGRLSEDSYLGDYDPRKQRELPTK